MRMTDLILKKRNGAHLTEEEISFLIKGYVAEEIPPYQISAWLMAVFFKGMSFEETGYLTRAMIASGKVFDLSSLGGPLVDKHSTGGVGDKVSLILAPLAAACGVQVPMMSGRALGHTGGTLDKLDSIPGYQSVISEELFRKGLKEIGFAMTGQSKDVVPADRLMYALRDVTGTVESVPLITASIMSKKFAEGAQSLIFDVKCGAGAFMKTPEAAEELAVSLVETGRSLDRKIVAVITNMDEPLGRKVGNFLEVEESLACLRGEGPEDLMEVTLRLTAWMVVAGGIVPTVEEALDLCKARLADGSAMEKFLENVELQGGDRKALLERENKARPLFYKDITAREEGYVQSIDSYALGLAGIPLGVGRNKTEDSVEPLVGYELMKKKGDSLLKGETLVRIWAESESALKSIEGQVRGAYSIAAEKPTTTPMILKEIKAL
ncbi:MAG: thymidine phosphorylase [Spirochaetales bacterium]|nr:thymidine phosphorylase [Spirochaetales bacterium]